LTELTIDRYQIKRLIGQGASGKVYLGFDPKIRREVAIKVISTSVKDQDIISALKRSFARIAALRHPNIVELYDYSGENRLIFIWSWNISRVIPWRTD